MSTRSHISLSAGVAGTAKAVFGVFRAPSSPDISSTLRQVKEVDVKDVVCGSVNRVAELVVGQLADCGEVRCCH